ncbi:hypothetical protein PVNG_06132 [Plasmodium vivax North Korean]|uniref:Variable surface protein Vir35 n=1 Tax=Plasmodium vivax North Korean TaxID=1035514 RepID=A0A0J9TZE6_PLAVI|nr:hypothetical protein PVNG_06132 [Plasmodium vivax North Korean]
MKFKQDISSTIIFNRSLAKHDIRNEFKQGQFKEKYSDYGINKSIKNRDKFISTYEDINEKNINVLDTYMKDYKQRYSKKKGLEKLDCYFEKRIFDKIDHIQNIAEKIQKNKKFNKNKIPRKYIYGLIIFGSLPFLGLVILLFFNDYNPLIKNWCLKGCQSKHGKTGSDITAEKVHTEMDFIWKDIDQNTWNMITTANTVFLCVSTVVVTFVLFYVLKKVIKYSCLKDGKRKICAKAYFNFIKKL